MLRIWLVFLFFVLSLTCENPFTTREPEPPDQQNPSSFVSPSEPERVFINLQLAFQERNVENYMRSFVDSTRSGRRFEFVPDQGVATTQPGTFSNWNLDAERRYLVQLFQATSVDSVTNLSFSEDSRTETAMTATITQNYTLIVRHSRQSQNFGTEIRGQSRFLLESNDTGDWAIYRWEDFKTFEANPSWTELKAFFQ